jgi:type IV secretion system protein VirB2
MTTCEQKNQPNQEVEPTTLDAKNEKTPTWRIFLALFVPMMIFPELAHAGQPWDNAANTIIGVLNGGLARSLAIIAVMGLGIMGLIGKLTWKWAGSIIGGIIIIFGAAAIVDFFAASV